MRTILRLRKQEFEVDPGVTVREALIQHSIQPDTVIPIRDGELVAENEVIREGETIRLVPVISGGGRD